MIKPDMVEYEKELAIHDYIISNAKYDFEYDNYADEVIRPIESKAYEVLVKGIGVDKGFSAAFQLLLNEVGIPCYCITGSTSIESEKTWNIVTIVGKNYHVDISRDWADDTIISAFEFPGSLVTTHACFNISDNEMKDWIHSYSWNSEEYITNCTSTDAEYICTAKTLKEFVSVYEFYASNDYTHFKIGIYNYDKKKYSMKACVKAANKDLPFWQEATKWKVKTSTRGSITVLDIKVTF